MAGLVNPPRPPLSPPSLLLPSIPSLLRSAEPRTDRIGGLPPSKHSLLLFLAGNSPSFVHAPAMAGNDVVELSDINVSSFQVTVLVFVLAIGELRGRIDD